MNQRLEQGTDPTEIKPAPRTESASDPVNTKYHSILTLNPKRKLYRFEADATTGDYTKLPQLLKRDSEGYRKVFNIAGEEIPEEETTAGGQGQVAVTAEEQGVPEEAVSAESKVTFEEDEEESSEGEDTPRSKVAVALLPIKEEPNTGFISCYLLNARRLHVKNTWTIAEWSDQEQVEDRDKPKNKKRLSKKSPERLLVATAQGVVYDLKMSEESAVLKPQEHQEVWRLLRNGCLAGEALVDNKLVPLINLAGFTTGELETQPREAGKMIGGTLDFKWPQSKQLRVVFKPVEGTVTRPLQAEYLAAAESAKKSVEDLARMWLEGTSLSFFGDTLPRDPDVRTFSEFNKEDPQDYDILISLDPLGPGGAEIPKGRSRDKRAISLPMSELGSYATRVDFGVPTIYLGWPKGLKGEYNREFQTPQEYFGSRAFKHMVLHEFGHALGLPHLHQHPKLKNPFKDPKDVRTILIGEMGIDMTENEILEELIYRWPGSDDWQTYGDWPTRNELSALVNSAAPPGGDSDVEVSAKSSAIESVMMGLPARHIYKARTTGRAVDYFEFLPPFDKAWIKKMYPKKSGVTSA